MAVAYASSCSSNSTPSLVTSICRYDPKKKKKKEPKCEILRLLSAGRSILGISAGLQTFCMKRATVQLFMTALFVFLAVALVKWLSFSCHFPCVLTRDNSEGFILP